ncbi:MAG: type II toxin-antitoxin system RelB/DinJ family antitoxin [bacterium]
MKTVINVKTDRDVKQNAQKLANDLGLSLSAVINAFLKQFIRNQEVYFSSTPRMSREMEELLGTVESDIKKDRNLSRKISDERELKEYFESL